MTAKDIPEHQPGTPTAQPRVTRESASAPILVAYASRTGATAGVAEAIGEVLAVRGDPVEVRRMQDVRDLAPYRAVVAGSAIHGGQWLPEALQFLRTHQAALRQRPFAAFLVCMTLAMPGAEQYRQGVADWLAPVRALVPPVCEGLFAGALDLSKVPSFGDRLRFRLSVALGLWKEGDHRDWAAVRAWAERTRPLLLRPVRP